MVRLSRGYGALLHPLVDSKGNFGKVYSRDMAYAASRYTEVKLDPICGELFRDIDKDAVDFVANYDDTMTEPALLPTTFPNILVSRQHAASPWAWPPTSAASTWRRSATPPSAVSEKPGVRPAGDPPGPGFPHRRASSSTTGRSWPTSTRTGRGCFKVRAKWRYVKAENLIEVYEIPYSTTVEAILDKVAELIKAGKVREIADMRDETDLSGLKLAIDLKRGTDPDKLMAEALPAHPPAGRLRLQLQRPDGRDAQGHWGCGRSWTEWTAWRSDCVRRRA